MFHPMKSSDYEQKALNLLEANAFVSAQILAMLAISSAIRELKSR